ncbi:hypothetical protein [Methylocystis sp. SC2]|uniref:hypothetical protein n=1 Tax=Methylocystis sp. (strain SC2) TaxID=187303 RepID=UPI00027AEA4C|nr:hypothetical protein [Methylocystis sp. SC2]CCJ08610.1 Hypothetical protein BN69_3159 [Methylocystis sp. SC2]
MSVTLEKRRKVAELENFERRILQEKRRLLRELESLEKPFRHTRALGWIRDFSSGVAGEWRAVQGAASLRAPIWFYIVAGTILLGGVVVATLALRGAPAPRADGATLRQVETPTTPVRIEPAPATEAAQAADVAPSSAFALSAPPESIAPPTPMIPDSKELKERLLEAQAAAEPLPEPLPPPRKTDVSAAAPALGAARVPPPDAAPPNTASDDAPPVDAAVTAEPEDEAPAARTAARESQGGDEPANEGRRAKCFVKIDGRVLFERSCMLRQPGRSTLTLNAGADAVVLTQDHGRTWTASLGGRSLGKVYRTGECWGRRRQVFICAKGA